MVYISLAVGKKDIDFVVIGSLNSSLSVKESAEALHSF